MTSLIRYIGAVDLATLDDGQRAAALSQIQLVGQTPQQLWTKSPHPARQASAALNTVPLIPLLVALAANQRLLATRETSSEPPAKLPVLGILVSPGGERVTPLPRQSAALSRASLIVRWGFADGSLRFYRREKGSATFFTPNAAAQPTPSLLVARLHGGEVIDACCVSSDSGWLATGDRTGGVAVWRLKHRQTGVAMRSHGRLAGHAAPIVHLATSVAHRALASVAADGVMLLWDLRKCLLTHALRVAPETPSVSSVSSVSSV